jgi:hypothetical protein
MFGAGESVEAIELFFKDQQNDDDESFFTPIEFTALKKRFDLCRRNFENPNIRNPETSKIPKHPLKSQQTTRNQSESNRPDQQPCFLFKLYSAS